ncbi:MAG: putative bifunctional diguanylate cyclase/phosphodiesterase, partial [Burkholderiaceae bacterium]
RASGAAGGERVWAIEASTVGDAVEISLVDVSERSRTADALEHMAHHDVLTERLNRRGLERRLDVLLAAGDTPAAVVYVDLDRFKAINDVFGHATGDAVVVEVAQRLDAVLPDNAALARIGGDEFVAVLPGLDLEAAHRVAIEMLESLTSAPCLADGLRLDVEASLGVVQVAAPMRTREVIALADEACATSKRGGRGRITAVMPDDDTLDALRESVRLGSMLKTRLPVERMRLYAQPIVPLRVAYTPLSYEILLRTTAEDGRIEGPARLLDAAERHGGMPAIDRFVLERTLEHLAANPSHAEGAEFFAVNLSGPSLNDERFVRDAVAMLRGHPTLARKLCLEITEAVAVYDLRGARRFIDAFLDTGATVALDDFGAGYTSFAYLKHLPASLIKIDGQFVVGLERDPRQRGIVQAIARLAHELDMRCLAEWVESPDTLRALLELDVDYAQGYLFDRPAAIDTWLERAPNVAPLQSAREGAAA